MSTATQSAAGGSTWAQPRWIHGPLLDLLLFVGTPALILPTVLIAERLLPAQQIYLFVASFGALGHHLPGMMRAYGDRSLFSRFKLRFIAAPLFLLAVCIPFAFMARSVLILVVFAWGMWHGLMQTHGFARIYDAKVGSFGRVTALLDQGLCLGWFTSAIVFSSTRTLWLTDLFYQSGGPVLPPSFWPGVQLVVGGFTAFVTVAWILNALRCMRAGHPPSPVKILLLATSLSFYFYANVVVRDMLIAVVLFEIFHDVQYLSIVWMFNRRRVESDEGVGGFTSFLFRRGRALVLLYVGLVFAYGSLNVVAETLPEGTLTLVLIGALSASALLHFYYDGFIWKVRDKQTRENLGIEGGGRAPGVEGFSIPGWLRHGLLWLVFFVLPVGLLGTAVMTGASTEEERALDLAVTFPEDARALRNRAVALAGSGETRAALATARRALNAAEEEELRREVESTLAGLLQESGLEALRTGQETRAGELLEEAMELDPQTIERIAAAAQEASREGRRGEALALYRAVLWYDPDHGRTHVNLASLLAGQGRLEEARYHARRGVELLPREPLARENLLRIEQALRARGPSTQGP